MKFAVLIGAAVTILAVSILHFNSSSGTGGNVRRSTAAFEPVAVIELFTSQGCSSCPPADRVLGQTIINAKNNKQKVFALSFHVDYWNRLGWTDPFSNPDFSARQTGYVSALKLNGAYTPQMIVNGQTEFTGSDERSLNLAISRALKIKAGVNFTKLDTVSSPGSLHVRYALEGNFSGADIHCAVLSLHESTAVKKGENGGAILKNDNVVRQFNTANASASGELSFSNLPASLKENIAVIAYVQEKNNGRILGAAQWEPVVKP